MSRKKSNRRVGRPNLYESSGVKIFICELGELFDSYTAAANRIGGRRSGVHACLKGGCGRHSHMGYTFKFVKTGKNV